jgi:hypothetical protein
VEDGAIYGGGDGAGVGGGGGGGEGGGGGLDEDVDLLSAMLLDDAPDPHAGSSGVWGSSPGGGVPAEINPPPRRKLVELRPEQVYLSDAYNAMWGNRLGSALGVNDESYAAMALGKGLNNPTGMNNCFLNVIIQSLFHIEQFR